MKARALEKCDIPGGASTAVAPTESLMAFLRAVITGDRMPEVRKRGRTLVPHK